MPPAPARPAPPALLRRRTEYLGIGTTPARPALLADPSLIPLTVSETGRLLATRHRPASPRTGWHGGGHTRGCWAGRDPWTAVT